MKRWWWLGLSLALTLVLVGGALWYGDWVDRQRIPVAGWTGNRVATPATYQVPGGQAAESRSLQQTVLPHPATLRHVEEADVPAGQTSPNGATYVDRWLQHADGTAEVWRELSESTSAVPAMEPQVLQGYLRGYQTAADGSEQRAEMRAEIERWLSNQYDQHLSRHEQQVEELEARVAKLRQQLERRQAAKAKLVELRLELMLSQADGLGWPGDPGDLNFNSFTPRPIQVLLPDGTLGLVPGGLGGPNSPPGGAVLPGRLPGPQLPRQGAFDSQGYSVPNEAARPFTDGPPANWTENQPIGPKESLELSASLAPGHEPERPSASNSPFITDQDMAVTALKQALLAVHNYEDVYKKLPFRHHAAEDPQDHHDLSWLVRVLPYMSPDMNREMAELFSQFDMSRSWDSPQNRPLLDKMPAILGQGRLTQLRWVPSYVKKFSDITDGLSNTIALIYGGPAINWTENQPLSQEDAVELFVSLAPGQELIVGMYDGSVRRLTRDNTSQATFEAMLTPNGGERYPAPRELFPRN